MSRAGGFLRNVFGKSSDRREATDHREIGWGGAKTFSGIVLDEYNPT